MKQTKAKAMQKVVIELTDDQLAALTKMRGRKKSRFFILGQAYIEPNDREEPIGTAAFFYLSEQQGNHIQVAISEARKMR